MVWKLLLWYVAVSFTASTLFAFWAWMRYKDRTND